MEEDKRNPDSRSPSPWPSWLEDKALSGQWEGAVCGSDLPLPHTEGGTLVDVDGDWKHDMDQELSQCGDANTWEEHGSRQELYPLEAVRVQEHAQGGARRMPGLYQWEEPVRVQELHQWEEDGVRYQELMQWEDDGMRYNQLAQWEGGVRYRELIQQEDDGRTYKQVTQWEDGVRYQELIQREVGVRYIDVTLWEVDGVIYQELTQCEEDGVVYHELTEWEGNGTLPEWSQWRDHIIYNIWDNAFHPMNAEDPQACPQQEPSSIHEEEGRGYQEVPEWQDDIWSVLSEEEFESPSVSSHWEDDSDIGPALEDWEHRTDHDGEVRPLGSEEEEWEEVSVLELSQGEGKEERLRIWEAEGLSVPAPGEAWAERRAPAPCTQGPVCVCPAQLAAQSPRGAAACAALEEQGAEAGPRSQGPAPQSPCCPPSPSPAQLQPQALGGQPAVPKERPSRLRRALRALRSLFRSCLAGQPQD